MFKWFFKPNNLLFAMHVEMTREVGLHVKGYILTNDSILTRTSDVVSFAAARARVTSAPIPAPKWGRGGGGEKCIPQARAAAMETTSDDATAYYDNDYDSDDDVNDDDNGNDDTVGYM